MNTYPPNKQQTQPTNTSAGYLFETNGGSAPGGRNGGLTGGASAEVFDQGWKRTDSLDFTWRAARASRLGMRALALERRGLALGKVRRVSRKDLSFCSAVVWWFLFGVKTPEVFSLLLNSLCLCFFKGFLSTGCQTLSGWLLEGSRTRSRGYPKLLFRGERSGATDRSAGRTWYLCLSALRGSCLLERVL